ncbi:MAG: DUF1080 domain-containing protein [Phycisphaerae bacterium]|nr:DUF1080 domain-containing protein [Phycisphaerae bacterium]
MTKADVSRRIVLLSTVFGVFIAGCHRPAVVSDDTSTESAILFDGQALGRWQAADFYDPGRVYVKDGRIVLERGVELTGIVWTGPVLRTDYEIALEAMRVEGEDFFCGLAFPVGEDYCSLVVGGWRGKVVGLSNIDLMDASENATTILLDFESNRWYAIRLWVTAERITVWIDGDKVIDAEIAGRIIDIRYAMEPCCPLGIASWKTTAAIRNIVMRPLSAEIDG